MKSTSCVPGLRHYREAYGEIKEQFSNDKIRDRRMAAYALAIRKIADIYESMHL